MFDGMRNKPDQKQECKKNMKPITIYALLLLTAVGLFAAPQDVILDAIIPVLPFVPLLFMGIWLTVVVKTISNPD